MIDKNVYDALKNKFSSTSSWAVWASPENGNWRSKDSISDLSCLVESPELLEQLTGDYIFVGLNPASHNVIDTGEPWSAFHSGDTKRAQDYKLRYALRGTEFWGSFMTDIYTGIVETAAQQAINKASPEVTRNSIANLLEIRNILGTHSTIVAMGSKAYRILMKELPEDVELKKIHHFSDRVNIDTYRMEVLEQLR